MFKIRLFHSLLRCKSNNCAFQDRVSKLNGASDSWRSASKQTNNVEVCSEEGRFIWSEESDLASAYVCRKKLRSGVCMGSISGANSGCLLMELWKRSVLIRNWWAIWFHEDDFQKLAELGLKGKIEDSRDITIYYQWRLARVQEVKFCGECFTWELRSFWALHQSSNLLT